MSQEIIDPHRQATNAAGTCKAIVLKTARKIQGRQYVQVEGWQAIANAFGCVASSKDVRRVDTGYAATGEVRRMSDGNLIATAEGFLGDDEPVWAKRAEFAKRAMAQTRAISRACRSAFAFVVTLMDAGLETTPAEEMPEHHAVEREPVRFRPSVETRPARLPADLETRHDDPTPEERCKAIRTAITTAQTLDDLKRVGKRLSQTVGLSDDDLSSFDELIKQRRAEMAGEVVDG